MEPRGGDQLTSAWIIADRPQRIKLGEQTARGLRDAFLNRGERDMVAESGLIDTLYAGFCQGKSRKEATQSALNIVKSISDIHLQRQNVTQKWSVPIMNDMFDSLFWKLADEFAASAPPSYLNDLNEQAEILTQQQGSTDRWYAPKIHGIYNHFRERRELASWLDDLKKRLKPQVEGQQYEQLVVDADQMWETYKNERAFGIKDCYFTSRLFLRSDQAFYIFDPELGVGDNSLRKKMGEFEAIVATGHLPTQKKVTITYGEEKEKINKNVKVEVHHLEFENAHGIMFLTKDGRFYTNARQVAEIEQIFRKAGMEKEYQFFRLIAYMRLSDLTRRIDPGHEFPSIDEFEKEAVSRTGGILGFGKKEKPDYKKLLVPRTAKNVHLTEDVKEETQRFVDKYKVVWFTRKLPVGYHATNRAVSYAAEHGVTLLEGQTIVREHWRGNTESADERPTRAQFGKKANGMGSEITENIPPNYEL